MIKELMSKGLERCFRVNDCRVITIVSLFVLSVALSSCTSSAKTDSAGVDSVKTERVEKDYVAEAKAAIEGADAAMGDWQGSWTLDDGTDSGPLVAQVIALAKGQYRANFLEVFDVRTEPIGVLNGRIENGVVRFAGQAYHSDRNLEVKAKIAGEKLTGAFEASDAWGTFALEKVIRVSPTMGAKPPKGAVVLFTGKDFKQWKRFGAKEGEDEVKWELVDGAMCVTRGGGNIITRKQFNDVKLHVEFRSPFMPEKRGQGRGNSGVYLQGRYEVQVLDSYGLEGKDNECGGIYKVRAPRVNMCAPPMQWQTYDITFTAPKFNAEGKLEERAKMTVLHNGVLIQDKTEVGGSTTASAGGKASEPGGVYLQDHGNQVEYRNIWLVER